MAEFIKRRWTEHFIEYVHIFQWNDGTTSGFSFECDSDGTIHPPKNDGAAENRLICAKGVADGTIIDLGMQTTEWDYTHPAIIKCQRCTKPVELSSHWANQCDHCGVEYDAGGGRLAPRSQWGEDTGESIADMESSYDPEAIYQESDLDPLYY